ncbi:MAG: sel1 repeat family protein [Rhodospirillales bacterium]|nr:sel1 repeat family protein [Rhodospirillales bacterium]
MYLDGVGIPQNYEQAQAWFQKAAEAGDVQAMMKLGKLYIDGRIVERDFEEAEVWYRKALANGNIQALMRLGDVANYKANATDESPVEAYAYYATAVALGERRARNSRDNAEDRLNPQELKQAQQHAMEIFERFIEQNNNQ